MSNSYSSWLAPSLLPIVLLACVCCATQTGPATEGDARRGQSVWALSGCIGCHGVNALGSTGGPALANTPLSIRDVINIVRRGGPGMPKYPASQISDQDLQDMYAWFQNPVPAATGDLGQDLWAQSACASCHGTKAEGGIGPSLVGTSQPFADFQAIVRQGAPGMPKYPASQISDQDLQDMYAWIQKSVPAATGDLGQDLWAQSACASCHGTKAEGGIGPSLVGTSQPFADFQAIVRQGAPGMPPFSGTQISDETLQAMHAWLQTHPQVPPAQENPWVQAGCGVCHGANAEGGLAPALTAEGFSYDQFRRVVREGDEGMPAYSTSQISDTDLQRMYDWLMALP